MKLFAIIFSFFLIISGAGMAYAQIYYPPTNTNTPTMTNPAPTRTLPSSGANTRIQVRSSMPHAGDGDPLIIEALMLMLITGSGALTLSFKLK